MQVSLRHAVLYSVDELGGRANGKTYIQKLCFFVGKLTGQPFGFRAHYYGPYSDQVSAELGFLTSSGYLLESRSGSGSAGVGGWEIARYNYRMTDAGMQAVKWLDEKYTAESTQIRDAIRRVLGAGDLNYVGLSFAAKTIWIIEHKNSPMTIDGIKDAARQFKWNVSGDDVSKASEFLQKLDLVRVVGQPERAQP